MIILEMTTDQTQALYELLTVTNIEPLLLDQPVLKMTTDQAQTLHELLTVINIEPLLSSQPLLNSFNPLTDHLLWPILDTLRQQMQIQQFSMA